jgi:hypothetical protein
MKNILALVIFFQFTLKGFSQEQVTQNYEEILKNEKLKTVKTMYYETEDTTKFKGRLLFRKKFDKEGKLIQRYDYIFWDVVSYDFTTSYKYDLKGNLIEETVIQKVLNLGKRDAEFIKEMGDDPIHKKYIFTYDASNKLAKEMEYTFGREGFDKSKTLNKTTNYYYNTKNQLIKEVEKEKDGAGHDQYSILTYEYDTDGNKIKETTTYSLGSLNTKMVKNFLYNSKGQLIEERTKGSDISSNNEYLKYKYNTEGKRTMILKFSEEENKWIVSKTFLYDKNGRLILGDDETTFDFYKNGLIKRELWKSKETKAVANFITTYEFY